MRQEASSLVLTDDGSSGSIAISANALITQKPLSSAQLADAEIMLSSLHVASDRTRLENALLGYRNMVTEYSAVSQFKFAWPGIEALLRDGGEKKPPIKRFLHSRYPTVRREKIDNMVDAVYKVRNPVDHENDSRNPSLGSALTWTRRAFSEALADALGIDIGRELSFS
ncbi:MAG: hypothetical protein M3Z35_11975 [Nitrospirota bacterium]|nr:hypothetical protein [Nitrospirota bacterium]